jgi:hypothetical protein
MSHAFTKDSSERNPKLFFDILNTFNPQTMEPFLVETLSQPIARRTKSVSPSLDEHL